MGMKNENPKSSTMTGAAGLLTSNDKLEETAKLDMTPHGVRVPHMIDFTPDPPAGSAAAPDGSSPFEVPGSPCTNRGPEQ